METVYESDDKKARISPRPTASATPSGPDETTSTIPIMEAKSARSFTHVRRSPNRGTAASATKTGVM